MIMKVYVVIAGNYSDAHIKYVATSREIAEALVKRVETSCYNTWAGKTHIKEYEVFEDTSVIQETKPLIKKRRFVFKENGEIYGIYEAGYSRDCVFPEVFDKGRGIEVIVCNNNYDASKKIACDTRAEYLAKKYGLC